MARRSLLGWVVALAFLCSACAVDATVTVKVREDGSGNVSVDVLADAEAVQAVEVGGGTLEDRVRLADLPEAGWTVEPWARNPDGSASLTLRKSFSSVDEVPGILAELNGPHGPLRDASFERDRSFFATEFSADAVVDLGAITTGISDDAELVSRLAAEGLDVGALDQQLLGRVSDAVSVRLVVDLPGAGTTVVESVPGEAATLAASSSVRDTTRLALVLAAVVLAVLALVVVLWPRRRGRPGRGRGGDGDSGRDGPPRTLWPTGRSAPAPRRVWPTGRSAPARPLSWEEATSPTRPRTPPES